MTPTSACKNSGMLKVNSGCAGLQQPFFWSLVASVFVLALISSLMMTDLSWPDSNYIHTGWLEEASGFGVFTLKDVFVSRCECVTDHPPVYRQVDGLKHHLWSQQDQTVVGRRMDSYIPSSISVVRFLHLIFTIPAFVSCWKSKSSCVHYLFISPD